MKLIQFSIVFGIVSIILAVVSAILLLLNCDTASAIGTLSTIISTLLSVVSILYTYISGDKTNKLLDDIDKQNKLLSKKIQLELIEKNFDEENIDNLRKSLGLDT